MGSLIMGVSRAEVLEHVFRNGRYKGITRYYTPFSISECSPLELFQAIGNEIISGFSLDSENRFLFENLIRWIHGSEAMLAYDPVSQEVVPGRLDKGIYIAGPTGTGKTLALKVLSAYASAFQFPIKFSNEIDLSKVRDLYWRTVGADDIVADFIAKTSIQSYKEARMLCIEDLGREILEAVSMGNRMNVLENLLVNRGDNQNCLTLITSNLPIADELTRDLYGDRVVSRLIEMCNFFWLGGADRRKQTI